MIAYASKLTKNIGFYMQPTKEAAKSWNFNGKSYDLTRETLDLSNIKMVGAISHNYDHDDLDDNTFENVYSLTSALHQNKSIKTLKLNNCNLGFIGISALLNSLANGNVLETLEISCNFVDTENSKNLKKVTTALQRFIKQTPTLKSLNISGNKLFPNQVPDLPNRTLVALLEDIKKSNITSINLSDNGFSEAESKATNQSFQIMSKIVKAEYEGISEFTKDIIRSRADTQVEIEQHKDDPSTFAQVGRLIAFLDYAELPGKEINEHKMVFGCTSALLITAAFLSGSTIAIVLTITACALLTLDAVLVHQMYESMPDEKKGLSHFK